MVADTGPILYIVLIEESDVLRRLFGEILIPQAVLAELSHPKAPARVREFLRCQPEWLLARKADEPISVTEMANLHSGERAAISLAAELRADVLLIDDRAGVSAATARGIPVVGTLGILDRAARKRLIDPFAALRRLRDTNFRYRPALMAAVADQWRQDGLS